MKIAARSLLLLLLGVSVLTTGCVQKSRTTHITTTNTTNLPKGIKSKIFAVAAMKKTKDANKSFKKKISTMQKRNANSDLYLSIK